MPVAKRATEASSSNRASGAPMQKWMPPPKPMWAVSPRPTSKRPGSSNRRGSRLALPNSIAISSPTSIVWPAISTGSSTHRPNRCSGASQRIISSIAVRGATSPDVTRFHWSRCSIIARMPLPSVFTVASWPASSSTITVDTISDSVSVSPSSSTAASSLTSEPVGGAPLVGDQRAGVVDELAGRAVGRARRRRRRCAARTSSRSCATSRAAAACRPAARRAWRR